MQLKNMGQTTMKKTMELFAFYLKKSLTPQEIEKSLGITFKRSIEATYYAQIDDAMITYAHFNVITLIGMPKEKIKDILRLLGIKEEFNSIFQDYPIVIDSDLQRSWTMDSDKITLKAFDLISLVIISHVISQSVALEAYENKLSNYYGKSRELIDASDTFSMFKRTSLAKFAKQLILVRHDILIDLYLLDKPDILWDNEDTEMLYNQLARSLELKERFDVVEYKINSIKDDIVLVMDLSNHNHSSFLEWIIIVLIMIEIVMSVMEWVGLK